VGALRRPRSRKVTRYRARTTPLAGRVAASGAKHVLYSGCGGGASGGGSSAVGRRQAE